MRTLTHVYLDHSDLIEANARDGMLTIGGLTTSDRQGPLWIVLPALLADRAAVIDTLVEALQEIRGVALLKLVTHEDELNRQNVTKAAAFIESVASEERASKPDIDAVEDALDAVDLG